MVEPEEMQDRRVEIVDMHPVLDSLEPEIVGLPILKSTFHPASGHPHGEAMVIMVPSQCGVRGVRPRRGKFNGWRSPEFTSPNHEGVVE